jgi:hypothetical protein
MRGETKEEHSYERKEGQDKLGSVAQRQGCKEQCLRYRGCGKYSQAELAAPEKQVLSAEPLHRELCASKSPGRFEPACEHEAGELYTPWNERRLEQEVTLTKKPSFTNEEQARRRPS